MTKHIMEFAFAISATVLFCCASALMIAATTYACRRIMEKLR